MIIDFHTHCFPDALAPRALSALKDHALHTDIFPCTDGTRANTVAWIKSSGIDRAVICNIATNARQQQNVNNFAIDIAHSDASLYSLGSLHPEGEDKRGELLRLREAGIRGLKIHPDYIGIDIDMPIYDEIFSLCEEFGFFVLTHAGFDPVSPDHVHASPTALLSVITKFPKLKLIAAHMGGFDHSQGVLDNLVGRDIWFDTSLCSHRPEERENLCKILREHSPDRLLFGSDTPWAFITAEVDFIRTAGLSDEVIEKILYQNALAILED